MDPRDLPEPHQLVIKLAAARGIEGAGGLVLGREDWLQPPVAPAAIKPAAGAANKARPAAEPAEVAAESAGVAPGEPNPADPDENSPARVIGGFGTAPGSTEFRCFVGFLGGRTTFTGSAIVWQVFFLDVNLRTWLIVDPKNIACADRAVESRAPWGAVDHIWVPTETPVARGNSKTDPSNLFLTGAFTRAGDFDTSVRGDTYSPASGLICEAITPGGCGTNTRRP